MFLTKDIYNHTESFIAEMPKKQRKEYGQFLLSPLQLTLWHRWQAFDSSIMPKKIDNLETND